MPESQGKNAPSLVKDIRAIRETTVKNCLALLIFGHRPSPSALAELGNGEALVSC